jgi:hypothetical protein
VEKLGTNVAALRPWVVAAAAALLDWLVATALLIIVLRPLRWVLLGCAAATLAVVALYARGKTSRPPSEVVGLTFAFLMLEWPFLGLGTLLVLSSTTSTGWQ